MKIDFNTPDNRIAFDKITRDHIVIAWRRERTSLKLIT